MAALVGSCLCARLPLSFFPSCSRCLSVCRSVCLFLCTCVRLGVALDVLLIYGARDINASHKHLHVAGSWRPPSETARSTRFLARSIVGGRRRDIGGALTIVVRRHSGSRPPASMQHRMRRARLAWSCVVMRHGQRRKRQARWVQDGRPTRDSSNARRTPTDGQAVGRAGAWTGPGAVDAARPTGG